MPRFTLGGDSWSIEQDGVRLVIDANGRETVRRFVSEEKAAIQLGRLLAEKREAGWALATGPAPPPKHDEPRDPALDALLECDPYDRETSAIYADWYQRLGHPRGELIALQLAGTYDKKITAAIDQLLARYSFELLGPLRTYVSPDRESPLQWTNGFILGLVVSAGIDPDPEIVRRVVAHPSGRFLAELRIYGYERAAMTTLLAGVRVATLRRLTIVTGSELPALDVITRAALQRFELRCFAGAFSTETFHTVAAIASSVTELTLAVSGARDATALLPLFARTDLRISKLTLRLPNIIDPVLNALVAGPLAQHVESLDIAETAPESGMRALVERLAELPKLETVTLTFERIDRRALAALRAKLELVDLGPEEDEDDDEHFEDIVE